ncbi:MAG: HD-GYP domain-containing protein [Acidimicrobiia bacterium]
MKKFAWQSTRALPWIWAGGLVAFVALTTGFIWEVAIGAMVLAAGWLVSVPSLSGHRFSLAFAVAAAFPLLYRNGPDFTGDVALDWALSAAATGLLIAWLIELLRQEADVTVFAALVRQTIGIAVFLVIDTAAFEELSQLTAFREDGFGAQLVALALAGTLWFLVETFLWAYLTFARSQLSRRYLWTVALRDWPVGASLLATGALFGVAFPTIGPAALVIALIPYGFVHVAFHRYHEARGTYAQTIRALARIPEVAGLSPDGHSDRTADLAVAIGQELGLSPDQVTELSYASLMHDIGRITLNEPSIIKRGFTDEDIARWGAEIISEAPYLTEVAELVKMQHSPYRRPGEHEDESLPISSKIVKVASAFDHATVDLSMSALEALEILHRGAAYDYDPQVVQAVRKVLVRREVVAS